MIQRADGAWHIAASALPLLRASAIFFYFRITLVSLLASYPVTFQVVVIYDNIRIVSRIQSRGSCSVKWDLASLPLSLTPFVALSCHTSK